jgi:hypothetical protein
MKTKTNQLCVCVCVLISTFKQSYRIDTYNHWSTTLTPACILMAYQLTDWKLDSLLAVLMQLIPIHFHKRR